MNFSPVSAVAMHLAVSGIWRFYFFNHVCLQVSNIHEHDIPILSGHRGHLQTLSRATDIVCSILLNKCISSSRLRDKRLEGDTLDEEAVSTTVENLAVPSLGFALRSWLLERRRC